LTSRLDDEFYFLNVLKGRTKNGWLIIRKLHAGFPFADDGKRREAQKLFQIAKRICHALVSSHGGSFDQS
jgi:hypothetical protein